MNTTAEMSVVEAPPVGEPTIAELCECIRVLTTMRRKEIEGLAAVEGESQEIVDQMFDSVQERRVMINDAIGLCQQMIDEINEETAA